jgi:hypothetical protein
MFSFINDLSESHLIASRTSLKNWDLTKLSQLAYLYFLGLRILLTSDKNQKWATNYCQKAGEPNDFFQWRSTGNDLYVFLHALSADPDNEDVKASGDVHINPGIIRTWLRHSDGKTHNLFARLDAMFHITDSSMKSMRRIVSEWESADQTEQQDVLTKLVQMIHARAPSNSEILPQLKQLIKIDESASSGGTSSASVATVVGGLGAGFDPTDSWRSVYPKKKKKPVILHR